MKHLARQAELMREDPRACFMDGREGARGLPFEPLKHYFKIYVAGFPGAAELRAKLMECKTTDEVRGERLGGLPSGRGFRACHEAAGL